MTFRLTPAETTATIEKIAKINERAARKGFTGRLAVEVSPEIRSTTKNPYTGIEITHVEHDVEITGEAPSYNGWSLAAVLDFDPEAGLIVNTAPGVDHVSREGLQQGFCGHCNTVRNRRKAYLVRNVETGEQVQVGSTCIKDFLGWTGLVVFISVEDTEREIEDFIGGFGDTDPRYLVDDVLAVAWACIKVSGWVPASAGDYQATTRSNSHLVLNPPARMSARERDYIEQVAALVATEDIKARAAEVKAFILSEEFSGDSEYVLNLKALMSASTIGGRHFGLAVSAPQAHAKHQERTLVKAAQASLPASVHFGQVKDKVEFTGIIEGVRFIEGAYGTTTLYSIRNQQDGRLVKWFASSSVLGDKQGVEVTIKGTIKGHDTWQGTESTVLTRCKAL